MNREKQNQAVQIKRTLRPMDTKAQHEIGMLMIQHITTHYHWRQDTTHQVKGHCRHGMRTRRNVPVARD